MEYKPGMMAIIIGSKNPDGEKFIGNVVILDCRSYVYAYHWLTIPRTFASSGRPMSWHEKRLHIIRPDETQEQSIEAMNLLNQLPKEKI